ncbi:MAG TPA: MFS transporter [Streptosporangiaceae bacterium]
MYRYTNTDLAPARRPRTAADSRGEAPVRGAAVPSGRLHPGEARPGGTVLPGGEDFRRDAPTLLCYGAISVYAFWLYAYGPALALLRTELHFSYTLLGVYSALWSAGAVLTGVCFARLARRLPRAALLWYSAAGAVVGAALFAAARTVALTMLGAAMLGFTGTILLTCTQAILSDGHGPRRDRALTEANVGAAACAVLAPLLLGLLQGTPVGWRPALALPALVLAGLYLRYRREALPAGSAGRAVRGRLPLSCWLLATMTAIGIAIEFCPIYFGAELLTGTGLRAAQAATAMSIFYLGILMGRAGGVRLTRHAGRAVPLLWASLAATSAGFVLFWLAASPAPAIAGLFLCGLGIANLYPLSLALTLDAGPGHGDTANARIQLLGGVLVIVAPYLLGSLADQLGLRAAFTVEPVLIGACGLLLLAGLRLRA